MTVFYSLRSMRSLRLIHWGCGSAAPGILGAILTFAAIVAIGGGCNPFKPQSPAPAPNGPPQVGNAPPVPVLVAKAIVKDMPVEIAAIGAVEPTHTVAIAAQIDGIITQIAVAEGQRVKAGDLLLTIDDRPFVIQQKQAEADLARIQAELDKARLQAARYSTLVDKDYVTREQYEQAVATVKVQEAAVKAAAVAIERAQLDLSYTTLTAPVDGRVGELLVKAGNLVRARDREMPLLTLTKLAPMHVRFAVTERYLGEIRALQDLRPLAVTAVVKDANREVVNGTLAYIDTLIDRATGTIALKALFANEDGRLWPGQFVDVRLRLRVDSGATVIPSQALQTGQRGSYVWVVKPDFSIENRPVKTGLATEIETAIVEGLNADETVVTEGQLRLGPQSKVEIKPAL